MPPAKSTLANRVHSCRKSKLNYKSAYIGSEIHRTMQTAAASTSPNASRVHDNSLCLPKPTNYSFHSSSSFLAAWSAHKWTWAITESMMIVFMVIKALYKNQNNNKSQLLQITFYHKHMCSSQRQTIISVGMHLSYSRSVATSPTATRLLYDQIQETLIHLQASKTDEARHWNKFVPKSAIVLVDVTCYWTTIII